MVASTTISGAFAFGAYRPSPDDGVIDLITFTDNSGGWQRFQDWGRLMKLLLTDGSTLCTTADYHNHLLRHYAELQISKKKQEECQRMLNYETYRRMCGAWIGRRIVSFESAEAVVASGCRVVDISWVASGILVTDAMMHCANPQDAALKFGKSCRTPEAAIKACVECQDAVCRMMHEL